MASTPPGLSGQVLRWGARALTLALAWGLVACGSGGGGGPDAGGGGSSPTVNAAPRVYALVAGATGNAGSVAVLDATTHAVSKTLPVGTGPVALAVDNTHNRAYVVTQDSVAARHTLVTLDTEHDSVLHTLALSGPPSGVAVDAASQTVWVSLGDRSSVVGVDAVAQAVSVVLTVGSQPAGLAMDAAHGRLYVANSASQSVSVVEVASRSVVATVGLPGGAVPTAVVADAATGRVYVNGLASRQVVALDMQTLAVARADEVGFLPVSLALNPADNRVYAANTSSHSVSRIDPYLGVVATASFSGAPAPQAVVVDPQTDAVYVGLQASHSVVVLSGSAFGTASAAVASIPVEGAPLALAWVALNQALPVAPAAPGLGVRWTVRSPQLPSGNLLSVAEGAGRFVTVGQGGLIRNSTDGELWQTSTSGTSQDLLQVAWLHDRFVAVGRQGVLLTSADGLVWTARASGTMATLNGVAYGQGRYWAVGSGGALLQSGDGQNWSARSLGGADLLALAVDGASGRMVAVGAGASVLTSADGGVNWSGPSGAAYIAATRYPGSTSAQPARLESVVWTGSQFVASGGAADVGTGVTWSVAIRSSDGQSWTASPNVASFAGGRLVMAAGELLQAVPEMNGFQHSADGVHWTYRAHHPVLLQAQDFKPVQAACAASGMCVAVGPLQGPSLGAAAPVLGMNARFNVATSLDGQDWVHGAPGSASLPQSVAFDGQDFISRLSSYDLAWTTADASRQQLRSPLGWVDPAMLNAGTAAPGRVRYLNGQYWVPDNQGRLASSTDGVHWVSHVVPGLTVNGQLTAITWANGRYVAVGTYATIVTSTDGDTWAVVQRDTGSTNRVLMDVDWVNGQFWAMGQGGGLMQSADGLSWTPLTLNASNVNATVNPLTGGSVAHTPVEVHGIAYGHGVLLVSGMNSAPNSQVGQGYLSFFPMLLASTDGGKTWRELADSPEGSTNGLAVPGVSSYDRLLFADGRFYILSRNRSASLGGVLLSSTDGQRWVNRTPSGMTGVDFLDIAYGNGRLLMVGGSSQGPLWLTSP